MKNQRFFLAVPCAALIAVVLVLGVSGGLFAGGSKQNTFTLYTWAEMFPQEILDGFEAAQKKAYEDYSRLVEAGLARELARINLPLSVYTEWYWQIDLHNLFHFLKLRLDPHAQKEIRLYSEVLFMIVKKVAPRCCASFEEHILGGVRFSKSEFNELQRRLKLNIVEGGELLNGKALEKFEEKIRSGKQT
jgi:thymidylate synthase (FAD)